MEQDLLTWEEAARVAHVSPETIKYWKKTGRLQTVPKRISARSGKPYGQLVPRSELLKAIPSARARALKESHPGKLLTISEIARELRTTRGQVYMLVRKFGLEKVWIDGWNYMVDGDLLWQKLEEDGFHWYLTYRR